MRSGDWQRWTNWRNRLLLVVGLACVLAALAAPGARAQFDTMESAPATLDDYVAALQSAQEILAHETSGETSDTVLEQARAELDPIQRVLLPSGALIEVDPLLGSSGQPLSTSAARARIRTVLAQLRAAAGDDTAERLDALTGVLAGPQFVAGDSWWELFLRWLAEWADRLFPQPQTSPGATPAGRVAGDALWTGVGVIGAIGLLLLLAYWLRGFLGNFIGDAEATANNATDDLPQTPAEARRRAADRAAGGDFRDAVRNLYLSALLTLEQNGLVPADRSLTNREVLARVASNHPVRPHLQPVVETFDDVWYGVHEPDDQTYADYRQSIDELEALTQRSAKERQP